MSLKKTLVHVTHETTHKIGGIGTVLEGLLTCRSYLAAVERSIIIGPLFSSDGSVDNRLGSEGKVLYSSLDGLIEHPLAIQLAEVERKFNVTIVYGQRTFYNRHAGIKIQAEVILIDVTQANPIPVNALKAWMYEEFGIKSDRYEHEADYEQYVRLAPAALAACMPSGRQIANIRRFLSRTNIWVCPRSWRRFSILWVDLRLSITPTRCPLFAVSSKNTPVTTPCSTTS